MTKIIKYQNDYTGEVFDNYMNCFKSEMEFKFGRARTGIVAVFNDGKIGDISEVFDETSVSGLNGNVINAIIFPSSEIAHTFINDFHSYWLDIDGSEPTPFDPSVCDNNKPDTLIFIPSINTDDENYPAFICAAEAKLIINSFRQDMIFAEKAKMIDNSNKV